MPIRSSSLTPPPALQRVPSRPSSPAPTSSSLKRSASPSFEDVHTGASRKRMKEEQDNSGGTSETAVASEDAGSMGLTNALADQLAQELECGCCSALVYRPVIVAPCQHFFCGSCCILWIRNGGTNCPACRGVSTIVTPFRAVQGVLDALLRVAPEKARPERERQQADEIYRAGSSLRLPVPREASPEPNLSPPNDFARPCPHCTADNQWGWRCPQPIADPHLDPDHAWPLEDGLPPGHGHCGNCENMLALTAPMTSKCDLCQVSFCGIRVEGRCVAAPLLSQHPHGMSDVGDLVQSPDVYDCFEGNTVEVDIMIDYLKAQRITPIYIYRQIVEYILSKPEGFRPLIELDLFMDNHNVAPGPEPDTDAPRTRICRLCAVEVLLWGLKGWWTRERQKGFLETELMNRKDCPEGSRCPQQKDPAHAHEFNHIIAPGDTEQPDSQPMEVETSDSTAGGAASSTSVHNAASNEVITADFTPTPEPEPSGDDHSVSVAVVPTTSSHVPMNISAAPPIPDDPLFLETIPARLSHDEVQEMVESGLF